MATCTDCGCHYELHSQSRSASLCDPCYYIRRNLRANLEYRAKMQIGTAEQRAAKDLGVEPERLALAAIALWKRTFSEERDARIDGNPQERGHITRQLKTELARALQ